MKPEDAKIKVRLLELRLAIILYPAVRKANKTK